jgi:crotonobetainyl-CoA:carnitine CoA-transferase CaiB-like acyl-CoA transferase
MTPATTSESPQQRAIALDIGKPAGRAVLGAVEDADILIELPVMERWDIGYDTLAALPAADPLSHFGFGATVRLAACRHDAIPAAMTD